MVSVFTAAMGLPLNRRDIRNMARLSTPMLGFALVPRMLRRNLLTQRTSGDDSEQITHRWQTAEIRGLPVRGGV